MTKEVAERILHKALLILIYENLAKQIITLENIRKEETKVLTETTDEHNTRISQRSISQEIKGQNNPNWLNDNFRNRKDIGVSNYLRTVVAIRSKFKSFGVLDRSFIDPTEDKTLDFAEMINNFSEKYSDKDDFSLEGFFEGCPDIIAAFLYDALENIISLEDLTDEEKETADEMLSVLTMDFSQREQIDEVREGQHDIIYRNVWFVPRPQRDPQYFPNALEALKKATNNFEEKWASNKEIQKKYEEVLASNGWKRATISRDGSGGRTWVAMLRTYSLVYLKDNGCLQLTKVGKALLDGNKKDEDKKFKNLTKQLLTLQIPNAYFESNGFRSKFSPDFQIRPIRFLIRLVCQPSLDYYITKEEITFFAMTTRRDSQLAETTEKILQFRRADESERAEMKRSIAEQDYRQRIDSTARDFEEAHGDVAHTFMLQAEYTELVGYNNSKLYIINPKLQQLEEIEKTLKAFDKKYPFDDRYKISEMSFGERAGLDVDSFKSRVITDEKVASNRSKEAIIIKELSAKYPNLSDKKMEEVIEIVSKEFPPKRAEKIAQMIVGKNSNITNIDDGFIRSYLSQRNDLEFEIQSAEILKALGFETVLHPKPVIPEKKTSIDILIHVDDKTAAIIDAKNYQSKFFLSANLANHMAVEYIPEYEGYEGKCVKYFGYITASKIGGEVNLKKIIEQAKVHGSGIDVSGSLISANALLGLLDYCLEHDIEIAKRKDWFIALLADNKAYELYTEVADRLGL